MASDGSPGQIPVTSLLQRSQAASSVGIPANGKPLPAGGKNASRIAAGGSGGAIAGGSAAAESGKPATAAAVPGTTGAPGAPGAPGATKDPGSPATDPNSIVITLNKHLNDSGRPDQFRVDPASSNKIIQEINPATGEVVGEFSVDEFPALARSIGATGALVDTVA